MPRTRDAIPAGIYNSLCAAVRSQHQKMRGHNVLDLKYVDYLNLFVAPEARAFSVEAPKQFKTNGPRFFQVPWRMTPPRSVTINFDISGGGTDYHPLIPRGVHLQETADLGLVTTVTQWAERQVDAGHEFGRVLAVLDKLNKTCTTPAQVRFFFPGVLTLLSTIEDDVFIDAFAERVRAYKAPDKFPALGPAMLGECHKASATVALAHLLSEHTAGAIPEFTARIVSASVLRSEALGEIDCLI